MLEQTHNKVEKLILARRSVFQMHDCTTSLGNGVTLRVGEDAEAQSQPL